MARSSSGAKLDNMLLSWSNIMNPGDRGRLIVPVLASSPLSICVVKFHTRTLFMAASEPGGEQKVVDAARSRPFLTSMEAVDAEAGEGFDQASCTVQISPINMQRKIYDCGVFVLFWGAVCVRGRRLEDAPHVDPVKLRVYNKKSIVEFSCAEARNTRGCRSCDLRHREGEKGAELMDYPRKQETAVPAYTAVGDQPVQSNTRDPPLAKEKCLRAAYLFRPRFFDEECEHTDARYEVWRIVLGALFRCLLRAHPGLVDDQPLSVVFPQTAGSGGHGLGNCYQLPVPRHVLPRFLMYRADPVPVAGGQRISRQQERVPVV